MKVCVGGVRNIGRCAQELYLQISHIYIFFELNLYLHHKLIIILIRKVKTPLTHSL